MEQTILQLPMQSPEPPALGQHIGVIYQQVPPVLPVLGEDLVLEQEQQHVPAGDLNKPQQKILETLFEYGHLTADDLLEANNWRAGYLRDIQKHLKVLNHGEKPKDRYVEKITPAKQIRFGSAPYIYTVGRAGYQHLKSQGYVIGRSRGTEEQVHKGYPLSHRLAVNRVLLLAKRLEREYRGVFLDDYLTEKQWNAEPLRVKMLTDAGLKQVFDPHWADDPLKLKELIEKRYVQVLSISADLLLHFAIDVPKKQYRFLPEINLSKVSQTEWRMKVRAYLYCLEAYFARFGTKLLTSIPVLIASDVDFPRRNLAKFTPAEWEERRIEARRREKRMENFIEWTEAELTKLQMQADADLFCFTSVPLDEITPYNLFFSPVWSVPFSKTPVSLMRYQRGDDGT